MREHRVIRRSSEEWPHQLENMGPIDPPEQLHVLGGGLGDFDKNLAIVGTRKCTVAGLEIAESFAEGLAQAGYTIVSGLARGIDAAAHRAALEVGGHTIAVLGCGLDQYFPTQNRTLQDRISKCGTVVSEYPAGAQPLNWHFPRRNRIIAGLSKAVIVVEGGFKSGAMITARLALDANRDVYAVPGSVRNAEARGPNELIRTAQAALATDVKHVLEDLAPGMVWGDSEAGTPGPSFVMEANEREVLLLLDDTPAPPQAFARHCDLAYGEVALALAKLEVRGLVTHRGAGYSISKAGVRARSSDGGRASSSTER